MTTEENKQEVLDWIEAGCNYQQGTMIYSRLGKNGILKQDFPGKQYKYQGKLLYELCKSVGLDHTAILQGNIIPVIQETVFNPLPSPTLIPRTNRSLLPEPDEMPESLPEKHASEFPAIIRRVISEYAETFQERSKTHAILVEMPESNAQTVKIKRAELFSIVKTLSDRLELLYQVREEYTKTGTLPLPEVLWPVPSSQPEPTLPDSVEELKKKKKNLQSSNSKDQSKLDYQSVKQSEFKTPMPAGTKRQKLENHIKARIKLIEEIDYKLLSIDAI